MTVSSVLFDADGTDSEVKLDESVLADLTDRQLLWVDVDGADEQDVEVVGHILGFERSLPRLSDAPLRPRLDFLDKYLEINVLALGESEQPLPLDILAGQNWIATVHRDAIPFIREFRERLAPDAELGLLTAVSFLAALLDWHVGTYFAAVDELERVVDRLDDRALHERADGGLLLELSQVRRRIGRIRRTLTPHREVFAAFVRPDFEVIATSASSAHYRLLVDRLERAIGAVENVRELLLGSFDIFMSRTAQRTNDVMRILTIVSVILLPAGVLAGVMGMNFRVPFFDEPAFFWLVVGAMGAIAGIVLALARRQHWI